MWPKRLCHNEAKFSLSNFHLVPHDSTCKVSLQDEIVSNKYRLSKALSKPVPTIVELIDKLKFLFPKEQQYPNLSNAEIETKFRLNDGTTKVSFKSK